MKEIKLTQGKVALVDDEDFEKLNQFKWYTRKCGNVFYAARMSETNLGYRIILPMHRVVMNTPKDMKTDHIDHNGLNNQKSNLRICTNIQNVYNKRPQINSSSKYRGVSFIKSSSKKKWRAAIKHNGKDYHLGCFEYEIDAAKAYNIAANKFWGEFAYMNQV